MVRPHDERLPVVVLQRLCAVADGIHYPLRDGHLFQVERSSTGCVEVSVHPDEGSTSIWLVRRGVERVGQAAVEMPGDEKMLAFRPYMGKSTPLLLPIGEESLGKQDKSRDDSRLSRLDSLRYRSNEQYCACLECGCEPTQAVVAKP